MKSRSYQTVKHLIHRDPPFQFSGEGPIFLEKKLFPNLSLQLPPPHPPPSTHTHKLHGQSLTIIVIYSPRNQFTGDIHFQLKHFYNLNQKDFQSNFLNIKKGVVLLGRRYYFDKFFHSSYHLLVTFVYPVVATGKHI